jgi:GTP cyclohydrolase I
MGQDDGGISINRINRLARNCAEVLTEFEDEPLREGLRGTPERWARMLEELLVPPLLSFTTFDAEGYDEMVVVKQIPFYSLCEHHIIPFFGVAAVGYIPVERIVGLSKLARVVEHFARRLQNQERLTQQVGNYVNEHLKPKGLGVVLKARHLCMEMRGVRKPGAHTTTSVLQGCFREPQVRAEFLHLANGE